MSGALAMVAAARGEHWQKSVSELKPLTVPLAAAVKKMTPSTAARVASISLPISIVVGAVAVFGDSVRAEIEINNELRRSTEYGAAITPASPIPPRTSIRTESAISRIFL